MDSSFSIQILVSPYLIVTKLSCHVVFTFHWVDDFFHDVNLDGSCCVKLYRILALVLS